MQIVNQRGGVVGVGGVVAVAASWVFSEVLSASIEVGVGRSPPSDEQEISRAANISTHTRRIIFLKQNVINVASSGTTGLYNN